MVALPIKSAKRQRNRQRPFSSPRSQAQLRKTRLKRLPLSSMTCQVRLKKSNGRSKRGNSLQLSRPLKVRAQLFCSTMIHPAAALPSSMMLLNNHAQMSRCSANIACRTSSLEQINEKLQSRRTFKASSKLLTCKNRKLSQYRTIKSAS